MDPMGDRFKAYERASEQVLPARLPVLVRLDGNSFSRLVDQVGFQKPFDPRFDEAMECAARAVLRYASGAQLGYVQSDEITVLLRNDQTVRTDPFLANRTQKLASLLASTASVAFSRHLEGMGAHQGAIFDARAFVVPPAEVNNAFLWRQKDAMRNCISSYAYHEMRKKVGRKTAQKRLHGLSTSGRKALVREELGVDWSELPIAWRRGRCLIREVRSVPLADVMPADVFEQKVREGHVSRDQTVTRGQWVVDREPPLFGEEPGYVNRLLGQDEGGGG